MSERPALNKSPESKTFKSFYFLKEELIRFCRQEGLQSTGSKAELTERISYYLDTGERLTGRGKSRTYTNTENIEEDSLIESNFICSEKHRAFFRQHIRGFSFNVPFQNWLKSNTGKTYKDAIEAYRQVIAEKKKGKSAIDKQFEYNTYIRDFFTDNEGKSLNDAIRCWKYKKSIQGHNRYEKSDLIALA